MKKTSKIINQYLVIAKYNKYYNNKQEKKDIRK